MNMYRIAGAIVSIALVGLMSAPAVAEGTLQNIATFESGSVELLVDTYTQGTEIIGLIGIKSNGVTRSYAFARSELPALYALAGKAERLSGEKYVAVGSVAEKGTDALDVLLMAGGPTVRISIADAVDGMLTFDLAPADSAGFDAALHKAGSALKP